MKNLKILGWPKSLFRFFYKWWENQTNFLANPNNYNEWKMLGKEKKKKRVPPVWFHLSKTFKTTNSSIVTKQISDCQGWGWAWRKREGFPRGKKKFLEMMDMVLILIVVMDPGCRQMSKLKLYTLHRYMLFQLYLNKAVKKNHTYGPFFRGLHRKVANKLVPSDTHFLSRSIQCSARENCITKGNIGATISSPSGPCFVRTLHHDPSILGGPVQHGS